MNQTGNKSLSLSLDNSRYFFLISLIIEFQWLTLTLGSDEFFVHPESRYFSLEKIGKDQAEDYAKRKGESVEFIEKFMPANLNYK